MHFIFSNKVDLSQVRSVVILRKKTTLKPVKTGDGYPNTLTY